METDGPRRQQRPLLEWTGRWRCRAATSTHIIGENHLGCATASAGIEIAIPILLP